MAGRTRRSGSIPPPPTPQVLGTAGPPKPRVRGFDSSVRCASVREWISDRAVTPKSALAVEVRILPDALLGGVMA